MSSHTEFQLINLRYRPPTPNKRLELHEIRSLNRNKINKFCLLVSFECMF